MIATTDLPATIEELHKLRNSVVADYIHAREMEQDREDDEDYTPGKSGRLMATLRAIDAKIATIPVEQPADTPVIDPNNMTGNILTTAQAAAVIGVSQKMVQSLIKRGRLPAEKIGRIWVVRREDAERHERGKGGRPQKQQGQA